MQTRHTSIIVTCAGLAGAASGSGVTGLLNGKIKAVHLNYSATGAVTTDVTIATTTTPTQTILVRADSATDGWFYPRVAIHNTAAVAITYNGTHAVRDCIPVADTITVTVAENDPGETVTVTILYEGE